MVRQRCDSEQRCTKREHGESGCAKEEGWSSVSRSDVLCCIICHFFPCTFFCHGPLELHRYFRETLSGVLPCHGAEHLEAPEDVQPQPGGVWGCAAMKSWNQSSTGVQGHPMLHITLAEQNRAPWLCRKHFFPPSKESFLIGLFFPYICKYHSGNALYRILGFLF